MDGLFFTASKIIAPLLQPGNALLVMALLGAAAARRSMRKPGFAANLMIVALVGLLAIAVLPLGKWLLLPLENRFPPGGAVEGKVDGIVLLGGTIMPWLSALRGSPQLNDSPERLIAFVELARAHPEAKLVFTGGSGLLTKQQVREADAIEPVLTAMGLDASRVVIERESRNTAENAAFAKRLVSPRPGERWLLVTSASHMPRSVGVFRKAGWPVEAYTVDYRTDGRWREGIGLNLAVGLELTSAAMHEWMGLLAYRLTDKTDSLLPGP
jgi:uncharacterized SAM-binding protein YcdF (DUF218 family)